MARFLSSLIAVFAFCALPSPVCAAPIDCNAMISNLAAGVINSSQNVGGSYNLEAAITTNMPGASGAAHYEQVTATLYMNLVPVAAKRGPRSSPLELDGAYALQYFSDRNTRQGPFTGPADPVSLRIISGTQASVQFTSQAWHSTWTGAAQCDQTGNWGLLHGVSSDGALAFTVAIVKFVPPTPSR
jgi:hypothetical protein